MALVRPATRDRLTLSHGEPASPDFLARLAPERHFSLRPCRDSRQRQVETRSLTLPVERFPSASPTFSFSSDLPASSPYYDVLLRCGPFGEPASSAARRQCSVAQSRSATLREQPLLLLQQQLARITGRACRVERTCHVGLLEVHVDFAVVCSLASPDDVNEALQHIGERPGPFLRGVMHAARRSVANKRRKISHSCVDVEEAIFEKDDGEEDCARAARMQAFLAGAAANTAAWVQQTAADMAAHASSHDTCIAPTHSSTSSDTYGTRTRTWPALSVCVRGGESSSQWSSPCPSRPPSPISHCPSLPSSSSASSISSYSPSGFALGAPSLAHHDMDKDMRVMVKDAVACYIAAYLCS